MLECDNCKRQTEYYIKIFHARGTFLKYWCLGCVYHEGIHQYNMVKEIEKQDAKIKNKISHKHKTIHEIVGPNGLEEE